MTLNVELVSSDRVVWSGDASMVIARTVEGDVGVLTGHQPMLSVLTDAVVEITPADGTDVVVATVDGGFISVAQDRVSILSETSLLAQDIDLSAAQIEAETARNLIGEADEAERRLRQAEARIRAVEKVR